MVVLTPKLAMIGPQNWHLQIKRTKTRITFDQNESQFLIEAVFLEGIKRGLKNVIFADSFSSFYVITILHNSKNSLISLTHMLAVVSQYVMETNIGADVGLKV